VEVEAWCREHETIAMSRFGQSSLLDLGIKSHYAPHAVETSVFRPTPSKIREQLGVPDDGFLVMINAANKGNIPPRKAWGEMLLAFGMFAKRHDDAYLYIHSDLTGNSGVPLRVLLQTMPVGPDRISWAPQLPYRLGEIPQSTLAELYSASDVLLATSYGEGFGIPVIEAQACGLPVIVNNVTAQPELCGAGWQTRSQPFWDYTQGPVFFGVPLIESIVTSLEAAYEAKGDQALRDQAVAFAADYDADTVYERDWRPILADLETGLTKGPNREDAAQAEEAMRAVVTGAFGFIGKHLTDRLLADGWEVIAIDDGRNGTAQIEDRERLSVWNVAVEKADVLVPLDAIFHLAAPVGPVGVLRRGGQITREVVETSSRVASWAISAGCPLIDVSTSEVYGSGGADSEDDPCTFQAPTSARKEYAVAKLAAETMLRNTEGLDVRIIRPFNVAGPGQSAYGGFVIPRFIQQARLGMALTVYEPGTQQRSFTHVLDVVDGLILAYEKGTPGEVYNLGNPANDDDHPQLAQRVHRRHGSGRDHRDRRPEDTPRSGLPRGARQAAGPPRRPVHPRELGWRRPLRHPQRPPDAGLPRPRPRPPERGVVIPVLAIPALNRPDLLRRHLASIDVEVGRLFVIDNSPDGSMGDVASELGIEVVDVGHNLGVAASWNLAIKITPSAPWWLLANVDQEYAPDDLERLARDMADPEPRIACLYRFGAFGINAAAVERAGWFDENFVPIYCETRTTSTAARLQASRSSTSLPAPRSSTAAASPTGAIHAMPNATPRRTPQMSATTRRNGAARFAAVNGIRRRLIAVVPWLTGHSSSAASGPKAGETTAVRIPMERR
jgi:UDP-glucose 4-epimerase